MLRRIIKESIGLILVGVLLFLIVETTEEQPEQEIKEKYYFVVNHYADRKEVVYFKIVQIDNVVHVFYASKEK